MFRFFRMVFRWFGGWFGRKADSMASDPNVMAATYDASIKKQEQTYTTLQDAVSKLLRMKVEKERLIKRLEKEVSHQENVKLGAGNKAKKLVEELKAKGVSAEDIKTHMDVVTCQSAFNDASAKVAENKSKIEAARADLKKYEVSVAQYKAQLQSMQRGVESLRNEKEEAIAETTAAKQAAEVNNLLAGVALNTQDQDLLAARRAREEAAAKATVAAEMAGNSAKVAEEEYVKMATVGQANDEFAALLGLENKEAEETLSSSKLAES